MFEATTLAEARVHAARVTEDYLACLAFPLGHRPRIRTTNGMERLSQELKRRTRVVGIFPNREACLRLVSPIAIEQSDAWVSGRRYLNVTLLEPSTVPTTSHPLAAD